ncbi:MAG TPA: hypothetical protein VFO18_17445 [Methylomirabilota bacterium]|nr:hypothetical protein [Methylomirabilota bacterium]
MFSGGSYEDVARWLANFVRSHAKREDLRVEAVLEAEGPREGKSYGVRLRLGERLMPGPGQPPLELPYREVADNRGSLAWCNALAARIRALASELSAAAGASRKSA